MGRIRRGGYIFEWFIGDHGPRHVHVYDANGRKLGRLALDNMSGLENWQPSRKLVAVLRQLQSEKRL
jgi:hypothetical protein